MPGADVFSVRESNRANGVRSYDGEARFSGHKEIVVPIIAGLCESDGIV